MTITTKELARIRAIMKTTATTILTERYKTLLK